MKLSFRNKQASKLIRPTLISKLNDTLVDEINIYHQAFLSLETPLMECSVIHPITKYELPICFQVQGDITGNIVCLLDTYKKELKPEELSLFQSLYIESMNILLGQYFTDLEEQANLTMILSSPIALKQDVIEQMIEEDSQDRLRLSMGYQLIYNTQEFNCRILLNLRHSKYSEV